MNADAALPRFAQADLQPLNTFGLPARAARMVRIRNLDGLRELMLEREWSSAPRLVLGGGSNLILRGDVPGLVLKMEIGGRRLVSEDASCRIVEAGAGEHWHAFVRWTLEKGWPGLENLSLIPGTVGAAPIQNIGAYGLEMAERFESLDAIDLGDGSERVFSRDDCRFAYRDSVFKQQPGRWLVTRVRFRLDKDWTPITR